MPPLPWEKQIPFSEAQLDTSETQPVPLETPTMASETQAGPVNRSRLRVEQDKALRLNTENWFLNPPEAI